jgi:hypothetical protein
MSQPSPKATWKEQIRDPKVWIILAIIAVLALNAIFYFLSVAPELREKRAVNEELQAVKSEHEIRSGLPDPERVTDLQIQELLEQVPTYQDEAVVLNKVMEYVINENSKLSFFGEEDITEELEENVTNDTESTDPDEKKKGIFTISQYRISAVGYLPRLINFFDHMTNNTAVTSVNEWDFAEVDEMDPELVDEPDFVDKKGIYTLTLEVTMYSIPEYRNVFGPPASDRTAIEDVLNKLQEKYPEVKSLESIKVKEEGVQSET